MEIVPNSQRSQQGKTTDIRNRRQLTKRLSRSGDVNVHDDWSGTDETHENDELLFGRVYVTVD
ncbi:hypothetical protein ACFQE8_22100 [Salinirubellus sp. GCM10025818]|uniref:hypothetical protein n=1 Tax=Salinirubellus TaxID=2162630 RepID=UPI0030CE5859